VKNHTCTFFGGMEDDGLQVDDIQIKTQLALRRIQQQICETEVVAQESLCTLCEHGEKMEGVHSDLGRVSRQLDRTSELQNTFDAWAGNWMGFGRRKANKQAKKAIEKDSYTSEESRVREIFECENRSYLNRSWNSCGIYDASRPNRLVEGMFDKRHLDCGPGGSMWVVDYSVGDIDSEGWTYAHNSKTLADSNGCGRDTPNIWTTFFRRRKWVAKQNIKKKNVITGVRERQNERTVHITKTNRNTLMTTKVPVTSNPETYVDMTDSKSVSTTCIRLVAVGNCGKSDVKSLEIDLQLLEISRTARSLQRIGDGIREEVR
jgi:hypothetical protein